MYKFFVDSKWRLNPNDKIIKIKEGHTNHIIDLPVPQKTYLDDEFFKSSHKHSGSKSLAESNDGEDSQISRYNYYKLDI